MEARREEMGKCGGDDDRGTLGSTYAPVFLTQMPTGLWFHILLAEIVVYHCCSGTVNDAEEIGVKLACYRIHISQPSTTQDKYINQI